MERPHLNGRIGRRRVGPTGQAIWANYTCAHATVADHPTVLLCAACGGFADDRGARDAHPACSASRLDHTYRSLATPCTYRLPFDPVVATFAATLRIIGCCVGSDSCHGGSAKRRSLLGRKARRTGVSVYAIVYCDRCGPLARYGN